MEGQFDSCVVVQVETMGNAPVWQREQDPGYLQKRLLQQLREADTLLRRVQMPGPIAKRSRQRHMVQELLDRSIPYIVTLLGDNLPEIPSEIMYILKDEDE